MEIIKVMEVSRNNKLNKDNIVPVKYSDKDECKCFECSCITFDEYSFGFICLGCGELLPLEEEEKWYIKDNFAGISRISLYSGLYIQYDNIIAKFILTILDDSMEDKWDEKEISFNLVKQLVKELGEGVE